MAALATQDDVEASLLRFLTLEEGSFIDTLLDRASRTVRVYTGQYIEEVVDDEVTITADLYGNLRLPQIPVTAVSSVVIDGDELDPSTYEWDVHGHITAPLGDPFELNIVAGWSAPVTVIYTHGYQFGEVPAPDDIRQIVADMIAARLQAPSGGTVKSAAVDDVRVDYDTSVTTFSATLTEDQRTVLDHYKQPARPINMVSRRVP